MKELVEVIARALVDNPDEVVVTETEKDGETLVELKVAPSDMGKVIGKQGRIAKAIRSVVKAAASKEEKRLLLIFNSRFGCRREFLGGSFLLYRLRDRYGQYIACGSHYLHPWRAWGSEGFSDDR